MRERLRAVWDLTVPVVREVAGVHSLDGVVQDLSGSGVRSALARLPATPAVDPVDPQERQLGIAERALRISLGEMQLHRQDPYLHIANLELTNYARDYAPAGDRQAARRRHLRQWPDAIDVAVTTLDRVSSPVAAALVGVARGLAADVPVGEPAVAGPALAALDRLVDRLSAIAAAGEPGEALGAGGLARLLGAAEGLEVDLVELSRLAEAERDRLMVMVDEAVESIDPGSSVAESLPRLLRESPAPDAVLAEVRAVAREAIAFTRENRLVPDVDGSCLVGPTPPSRRWVKAMMTWAAPEERDNPSWFHVTLPGADWPADRVTQWMSIFSRTTLPAITVHEVAPGHHAHGRVLRRVPGEVRRTLHSTAFMEGWAHYVEEVCVEEGFRDGDPRFALGVGLEALVRLTRLRCSIGLHTGAMDLAEAARTFEREAFLPPAVAFDEARRGLFDPTYGRYSWGKLLIRAARERARTTGLPAFHEQVLALGCPPLAMLDLLPAGAAPPDRSTR